MGTSQSKMPDSGASYPMFSEKIAERLRALEVKESPNDPEVDYVYVEETECWS